MNTNTTFPHRMIELVVIIVIIAYGAIACTPVPPFFPDDNLLLPSLSDDSLLTNKSCEPPCWYGVYPDVTPASEAEELVKKLPFVNPETVARDPRVDGSSDPAITWSFSGAWSSNHGGRMEIINGLVRDNRIFLPLGAVTLGSVLEAQGTPDLVVAGRDPESPTHWFQFYYGDKGLMLHGRKNGQGQKTATITSDISIIEAEYFAPRSLRGFLAEVRGYNNAAIIKNRVQTYIEWPDLDASIPLLSDLPR